MNRRAWVIGAAMVLPYQLGAVSWCAVAFAARCSRTVVAGVSP